MRVDLDHDKRAGQVVGAATIRREGGHGIGGGGRGADDSCPADRPNLSTLTPTLHTDQGQEAERAGDRIGSSQSVSEFQRYRALAPLPPTIHTYEGHVPPQTNTSAPHISTPIQTHDSRVVGYGAQPHHTEEAAPPCTQPPAALPPTLSHNSTLLLTCGRIRSPAP